MVHILVVEDDDKLRQLVAAVLTKHGYSPILAGDGLAALDVLELQHIDLVITDVMMPRMDGFELVRRMREDGYQMPVLMMTVKESFEDKHTGYKAGIDDYMVKPIDVNEMVLRIGALLRRAKIVAEHKLTIGAVVLDADALTVQQGDVETVLPQKEFQLLYKMLSYPGKIFTRQQLMDEIWGFDSETEIRTVDVHINRVRERVKEIAEFEIVTVRGLGYKAVKHV